MNDRLLRGSEDHIRFASTPSYEDSFDKTPVQEIRMMKNPELIYLSCLVLFDLAAKVLCSYSVLTTSDSGTIKWVVIAYAATFYNLSKILFNLSYYLIWPQTTATHRFKAIYRALYDLGFALITAGIGMYLEGKLDASELYGFALPHVIICSAILAVEIMRSSEYSPIAFYSLLESVQILLIYISIGFPEKNFNWAYVLFFYYIASFMYFALSIICFMAFVIIFANNCTSNPVSNGNSGNIHQITGSLVFDILFYIIWNGYAYYKIVLGLYDLLINNVLTPGWSEECVNPEIKLGFYVMLVSGIISLILLVVSLGLKRELLREVLFWTK